jgi:hypothetical protein
MTQATDNPLPAYARVLGWAGLLPFIGLPLAILLDPHHAVLWGEIMASYALAIICFLVGVWWGIALIRRSVAALVLSNALVIVAFFGHVLLTVESFLLLCALLFPGTVIIERRLRLFRPQPAYYARLRILLTVVATASLLIAAYGV